MSKSHTDDNLFRRLSKLFKSGPVIKKKIRTTDTTIVVPDKTRSSGTMLFQKSMAPTYATITANAYNLSERLARYQDFCFTGDTLVAVSSEHFHMRIDELCAMWEQGWRDLWITSHDVNIGDHVLAKITGAKCNGDRHVISVNLSDGATVRCTPDHRFMLATGDYVEAHELSHGSALMSTGEQVVVASVVDSGEIARVYDIEVKGYSNFAIATADCNEIIVHNCEMEWTPEIASALDIYADEAVACDEKGRSLHVYSDNEKIREALEDLFFNTLNVEFNLRSWVRNTCKFGDQFLLIDVSPEYGVKSAFPIPVNEMEREENYDRDDPFATRYRWVTLGNRVLENWEVAHMRLLGNDMFLPYGTSIIEPARRVWRQLILLEDAMMVYRVVRAPERRVFYIDVANIPADEVQLYMEEQRKQLRTNQVVDRSTGRVDLRYNALPIHKDTIVPLLDGTSMTIENLSRKMSEDSMWIPWVYSIQDKTHAIVPGKVVWCGKNYTAKTLIKVNLDDGSHVITAPEHPFVMRDGSHKRADQLDPNDSLMPLYRKMSTQAEGYSLKDYELTYNPASDTYEYTHRLVSNDWYEAHGGFTVKQTRTIHHADFNRKNNIPTNLVEMSFMDHRKMHADHCQLTLGTPEQRALSKQRLIDYNHSERHSKRTSEVNVRDHKAQHMCDVYNGSELHKQHNVIRREAQLKSWGDAQRKEERKKAMRWQFPSNFLDVLTGIIKANPKCSRQRVHELLITNVDFMNEMSRIQTCRDVKKFTMIAWLSELQRLGYKTVKAFSDSIVGYKNHKVASIEIINDDVDVYCMTVVGTVGEDDRHNFAILCKNNCTTSERVSSIFVGNSTDEDYFLPVRGTESGTKIDTLAGGQNTAAVEDVAYLQKKLFAALKIPRAYLGYDEALASKACFVGETLIPTLNGDMTIAEMATLDAAGELGDVYVNSYDRVKRAHVPGRVKRAWLTKHVVDLCQVCLDDATCLRCTPDHQFLCSDGTYVEAANLKPGTQLVARVGQPLVTSVHALHYDTAQPVYDIEVEEHHNFAVSSGGCAVIVHNSLAQLDIRFSRTISVIQKVIVAELNKIAMIHLYAHGFEGEDLQNFTLRLSNPSTVAQQQKLELWRAKFEIAGSAPEGFVNKNFIRREIWGLSDDECRDIDAARMKDKLTDQSIENAQSESEGDEGGGGGGGAEDIFGGAGEELGGGEEESPGGGEEEVPPPENAGEEPEEDVNDEVTLLTSSDEREADDVPLDLGGEDHDDKPVKPKGQLDKALYNRSRRRHSGSSSTHMPDYNKMVSSDNHSMNDPFDSEWMRSVVSNPFGESLNINAVPKATMTPDMLSTLNNLSKHLGVASRSTGGLLHESTTNMDDDRLFIVNDEGNE